MDNADTKLESNPLTTLDLFRGQTQSRFKFMIQF